jgi:hypothetical protein
VTLGALVVLVAGTSTPRTAEAFGERGSGAKIQPKSTSADKGKLRHRVWDRVKTAAGITLVAGGTTAGIKAMEPGLPKELRIVYGSIAAASLLVPAACLVKKGIKAVMKRAKAKKAARQASECKTGVRVYTLPKSGEANEDAFHHDAERGRYAVSDGASGGANSGPFAEGLVKSFVKAEGEDGSDLAVLTSGAIQHWKRSVEAMPQAGDSLFEQVKIETHGGLATLLGLAKQKKGFTGARRWEAYGLATDGRFSDKVTRSDTILFRVDRRGRVLEHWPRLKPEDFGSNPALVSTNPEKNGYVDIEPTVLKTRRGHRLVLATDAVAKRILEQHAKTGKSPFLKAILGASSQQEFAKLIKREWKQGLGEDDATVMVVPH